MAWSAPTGAAVAVGNVTGTSHAVTTGAVQAGDLIVVHYQRGAASNDLNTDVVTDSLGSVYAPVIAGFDSANSQGAGWTWAIAAASGTPTITVTYAVTHPWRATTAQVFRQSTDPSLPIVLDMAAILLVPSTTVATTDNATVGTVDARGVDELVVGMFSDTNDVQTMSPGTGFTAGQNTGVASQGFTAIEYRTVATPITAISATATLTGSGSRYIAAVASFVRVGPTFIASWGRRPVPMIQGPDRDRVGKLWRL